MFVNLLRKSEDDLDLRLFVNLFLSIGSISSHSSHSEKKYQELKKALLLYIFKNKRWLVKLPLIMFLGR